MYGTATLPAHDLRSLSCVALTLESGYELEEILKSGLSLSLGSQRHVGKISEAEQPEEGHQDLISFLPSFLGNVKARCILRPSSTSPSDPHFELPFPLGRGHASLTLLALIP